MSLKMDGKSQYFWLKINDIMLYITVVYIIIHLLTSTNTEIKWLVPQCAHSKEFLEL